MTQVFGEDGTVVPVTLIQAGPCTITQVRTNQAGVQTATLGFGSKKSVSKPQLEDWKELGAFAFVKEFPIDGEAPARGDKVVASAFEVGETVNVIGTAKGKGFQGVVKRHGFKGGPASHGHKDQLRMPGSIGATGAQRVFKGTRMGGRMGGQQVTVQNLEVVQVNEKENIIAVKGAIPGARGGYVIIAASNGDVWRA